MYLDFWQIVILIGLTAAITAPIYYKWGYYEGKEEMAGALIEVYESLEEGLNDKVYNEED